MFVKVHIQWLEAIGTVWGIHTNSMLLLHGYELWAWLGNLTFELKNCQGDRIIYFVKVFLFAF